MLSISRRRAHTIAVSSLGLFFCRDQRANRAPVWNQILPRHPADVFTGDFPNAVQITIHLPPAADRFVIPDLHRLAEYRILREYKRRLDLILGFLQFALGNELGFNFLEPALDLAL